MSGFSNSEGGASGAGQATATASTSTGAPAADEAAGGLPAAGAAAVESAPAGESAAAVVTAPARADPFASRPWLANYDPAAPREVEVPDITVDAILRDAASRHPLRTALVFFGARTTFAELDDQVDRFASYLRGLGLTRGDRVSLHLPTSPAFVITFLGALRAGCTVVPMNPLYVERELETVMRETSPRLSVCVDLLVPRVRAARSTLADLLGPAPGGVEVISTGIQDSLPRHLRWLYPLKARREGRWRPVAHSRQTPNLFRLLAATPAGVFPPAAGPDDPALLQPTGGTTGTPKAAVLTHRNLVANAVQCAAVNTGPKDRGDSILCTLPYFHIYGLTVAMNFALLEAATQVLLPRWDPLATLKAIQKEKPRHFPGAPIMYATLANHPDLPKYDIRSVEICVSGSAPLPGPVQDKFEAASGGRVLEGYGLTEASPVTHCNQVARERKLGTIGLPIPSTDARIVDLLSGTESVAVGEVGELCVRGPQVMRGYWNRPEESARVLRDGWLYTGDMATMDADGYFTIVDRRKDLIINGGINVYPREVEEVLLLHPAVADAVVVGQPDPVRGELPVAFVVPAPGASPTVEELLAHCRTNLARYKIPAAIEFRNELPRSTVGKVLRRVLAEERRAAMPEAPATAAATPAAQGATPASSGPDRPAG